MVVNPAIVTNSAVSVLVAVALAESVTVMFPGVTLGAIAITYAPEGMLAESTT